MYLILVGAFGMSLLGSPWSVGISAPEKRKAGLSTGFYFGILLGLGGE